MKKYRNLIIFLVSLWVVVLYLLIQHNNEPPEFTEAEFGMLSTVTESDEKVGANVKLLQAIHGTEGTDYRYSIDTDCPQWDFHTKYTSPIMINWAEDDTSAVEVLIKDVQVSLNDRVYASGQYYTVPLFGNLSSETAAYEEWKDSLVKKAYEAYASESYDTVWQRVLTACIFIIPFIMLLVVVIMLAVKDVNRKLELLNKDKEAG